MPVNFYIDDSRDVVVVRAHGEAGADAMLACFGGVVADARFRREQNMLLDCRSNRFLDPSHRLRDVARFIVGHSDLERCAVVITDDEGWGLARMFIALAGDDGNRFRPFRDYSAATRWLGCPDLPDHARLGTADGASKPQSAGGNSAAADGSG